MTLAPTTSPLDNLVHDHLDLVYAAALRQCRNPHDAADVTQAVFLILQRKLPTLPHDVIISAWLLHTTRFACLEAARRRTRRTTHERRASAMHPGETHLQKPADLSPILDDALHRLSEKDRTAIILAFLEELPHDQVARRMNITTAAAHKRIQRALARLRAILSKTHPGLAPAALSAALVLAANPAPAPAAVHSAVAASIAGNAPAAIHLLAKGTSLMMNVLKVQTAGTLTAAAALALAVLALTLIPPAWSAPATAPVATPALADPIPVPNADAFLPTVTLTLQELRPANTHTTADLDTGKTLEPNWGQPNQPPFGFHNQAAQIGSDLIVRASPDGIYLTGLDLAALPRPAREFDTSGPAQLLTFLMNSSPTTETLIATELPATYAFRTREGAVGLLQILSITPASGPRTQDARIQIRFKTLTPAARDRNAAKFAAEMILPDIEQQLGLLQAQTAPADLQTAARALARSTSALREITKATPNAPQGRATATAATSLLDAALNENPTQLRAALNKFTEAYTPAATTLRKPPLP